jgi:nucleoside-diphosphate-sugar epimerase
MQASRERASVKIALFGGSGRVGQALIPALLERGHSVRALQHCSPVHVGAQVIDGNMTDPVAVARVVENADIVMQLTMVGNDIRQPVEVSTHGTLTILEALRSVSSLRQYILTSSDAAAGIWAHPQPEPVSHRTPPSSYPGFYSLGKVLEETIVREYHRNYGLPHTIARLSWVQQEDAVLRNFIAGYDLRQPTKGPFSGDYLPRQKQMLEKGTAFIVMPCGRNGRPLQRTMVQREDVVDALLRMVGESRAIGETFHISGPAFDYDKPCQYLAGRMPLPVEKVCLDAYGFEIDCSHTTDLLGWHAKYDIISMLDAALAWQESIGH